MPYIGIKKRLKFKIYFKTAEKAKKVNRKGSDQSLSFPVFFI
jgi:hypothetical protein